MYSCRLRVNPLRRSKTVRQIFNLIYLPDSVTIMTLFHQQEEMEFDLDVTSVPSGGSETLTIVIEARTKGVASMGKQPRFNLTIPLRTAIDLEVSGYVNRVRLIKIWCWMGNILNRNSVDEQRSYNRPNETDLSTVKESIVFQHFYEVSYWSLHSLQFAQAECSIQVRNVLPSPANGINIEVLLPIRVLNPPGIQSMQFLTPENTSVQVWLPMYTIL